ncbi:MAG: MTH1187 family thiamine-binding protein [Desulfobacterales bacterium]|jgi:uncharacterized protein (TIGR00106 family)
MSVLIELSIFPMDKGTSLSPYVARAVAIIKKSGLPYRLGPMGTCIEGDWEAVMAVVNRCFYALKKDCDRLNVSIKVDYREGASDRISGKIASVERRL